MTAKERSLASLEMTVGIGYEER